MTVKKTVVYDCDVCGTEVTVNSEGRSNLSPIYCCGISLTQRKNKLAGKTKEKITVRKTTAAKRSGKADRQETKKGSQKKRTKK